MGKENEIEQMVEDHLQLVGETLEHFGTDMKL